MSTMPRVNRPGPRRRCSPCPACGEDAMRQYGAKHHGVVTRYFYACQACQHTDVWREVQDAAPRWERLRTPLVAPRPEQCRLELRQKPVRTDSKQAQAGYAVKNNFSLSNNEKKAFPLNEETPFANIPHTCASCARYFVDEALCSVPEEMLQEVALMCGMVLAATELPVNALKVQNCTHWISETECDRFGLLRKKQEKTRQYV